MYWMLQDVLLSDGRSIQTPEELHLLLAICRQQGAHEIALSYLNSATLGVDSQVAKGEWSFVLQKLETLKSLRAWRQLREYCSALLTYTPPSGESKSDSDRKPSNTDPSVFCDDWAVWRSLLASAQNADENEYVHELAVIDYIETN
jgi:hypothetical protein